jgi:uncharacterized damage-inducible protein DinB
MNNIPVSNFAGIIQWTHDRILALTQELSDEQVAQQASPTAPPIGWHVFHIGRWADRLQASIPKTHGQKPDLRKEIWVIDDVAKHWGQKPGNLGWLETGAGMDIESAVSLASIGKSVLLEYAQHTFGEANLAVGELKVEQLQQARLSIRPEYKVAPAGQMQLDYAGDRPVTVLDDLIFHISHASRHLGMIEALRGVLFAIVGTASV